MGWLDPEELKQLLPAEIIEVIPPEARRTPPYRFINDPFKAFQERESVKPEAAKADLLLPQAGAA